MQTSYQQYFNPALCGAKDSTQEPIVDQFAALAAIPIGTAVVQGTSSEVTLDTLSCATTLNSGVITPSSVTGLVAGMLVTGPGIPYGSAIGVVGGSTVTLANSVVATATQTNASITFGSPNNEQQVFALPTCKAPASSGDKWLGIAMLQEGKQQDFTTGSVAFAAGDAVPVASWGRIWVAIDPTLALGAISYGDPVYYEYSGSYIGTFTNVSAGNTLVANAKFRTPLSITAANGSLALVEMR